MFVCFFLCRYTSSSNSKASNIIKVKAPRDLPAGTYSILCTFSNNLVIETEKAVFTVYNRSAISQSSISPSEAEIKSESFNVTITGTGFVDTGYVACVKVGSSVKLGLGSFVSATEATCLFPSTAKSSLFNVSLVFGENDPPVDSSVEFSFYAVQPQALSVRFENNPSKLLLSFDKPAEYITENPDFGCSDFFDQATLAKFASDAKCVLRTSKKMIIKLIGSSATIVPGNTINFKNGSVAARGEANTKFVSGNTTLTVGSPPNPPVPVIEIFAPSSIGELCFATCNEAYI